MKMSDTAMVILSAAAARDDRRAFPFPAKVSRIAAFNSVKGLLAKGLIEEVDAGLGDERFRDTGDGHGVTLQITDTGLQAVDGDLKAEPVAHVAPTKAKKEPKAPKAKAPKKATTEPKPRGPTKQDEAIRMMKRKNGASGAEMAEAFGWQAHTVRGFIAAACKKKLGLDVQAERVEGRGTVYRIAA